jgi:hypothetical protein
MDQIRMPANAKPAPITLGDKLMTNSPTAHIPWLGRVILTLANIALLTGFTTVPLWLLKTKPEMSLGIVFALLVLLVTWLVVWRRLHFASPLHSASISKGHTLLANDRNGFMSHLRLDAKTAIIDGSNIYHFGHDNDVGTDIIRLLAKQLRSDGYRVVCFFDANIFYTLASHNVLPIDKNHSLQLLEEMTGLERSEIYVVPSGVQADKYILDSLKHLPKSFAVTNDHFRDHAKQYPTVMKGDQWRKGVVIKGNEIRLIKHKFQQPVRLA